MDILNIVENNPFRILGVYINASVKEIVANQGKAKAFLKVNKDFTFPSDFNHLCPAPVRTLESFSEADSHLKLANEKIKYALFWFAKVTPLDEIAFGHLAVGNIPKAVEMWDKKECFSSLLNKSVCALLGSNYDLAVKCIIAMLHNDEYRFEFIHLTVGDIYQATGKELVENYLDVFFVEKGSECLSLLKNVEDLDSCEYLKKKVVTPLMSSITAEINQAASTNKTDFKARYTAGVVLANNTRTLLTQLEQLLNEQDIQYRMIMDKLSIGILQCGIDYYNNSQEPDAAIKAMKLQKYALSIAVGEMAKQRCKENVDILQQIIDNLPPMEVYEEDKKIKMEIKLFHEVGGSISQANSLLVNCKPYMLKIEKELGVNNSYYLRMQNLLLEFALQSVINGVNEAQKEDSRVEGNLGNLWGYGYTTTPQKTFTSTQIAIRQAYVVIHTMRLYRMSPKFKKERYLPNKQILDKIRVSLKISMGRMETLNSLDLTRFMIWAIIITALILCYLVLQLK